MDGDGGFGGGGEGGGGEGGHAGGGGEGGGDSNTQVPSSTVASGSKFAAETNMQPGAWKEQQLSPHMTLALASKLYAVASVQPATGMMHADALCSVAFGS